MPGWSVPPHLQSGSLHLAGSHWVAASSAWTLAGALPSPRSYHRGVSINNHVIVTGGCGDIKTLLTMQNKR